jgi:hypothetical protein
MARALGFVSLLATLVLVGYLWMASARHEGPAFRAEQVENQATQVTAAFNLQQAAPVLEAWFAEHGTYAGATLPPSANVLVARADAASFCLQSGSGVNVQHLSGPGMAPDAGPC